MGGVDEDEDEVQTIMVAVQSHAALDEVQLASQPDMVQDEEFRRRLLGKYAPFYVGRRYVLVSRLFNDHDAYQRALNKAKVRRAVEEFHPVAVKLLSVNIRPDGTLWVMNGQHTAEIVARYYAEQFPDLDPRTYRVEADVFDGLSLEDEKLAWKANNTNSNPARYIETLRVRQNEPIIKAIIQACKAAGFELQVPPSGQRPAFGIQAVYAIEEAYKRGQVNDYPGGGFGLVRDMLQLANEAWGDDSEMLKGKALTGLAIFVSNCRAHPSFSLAKAAKRFRGKSNQILSYVRGLTGVSAGGVSGSYAMAMLKLYNRNLADEYMIPDDTLKIGRRVNKAA